MHIAFLEHLTIIYSAYPIKSTLWNPVTHCQEQNCPLLFITSVILGLFGPEDEGTAVL
jgi:hypothetical protein